MLRKNGNNREQVGGGISVEKRWKKGRGKKVKDGWKMDGKKGKSTLRWGKWVLFEQDCVFLSISV